MKPIILAGLLALISCEAAANSVADVAAPHPVAEDTSIDSLRVLSYNVQGLPNMLRGGKEPYFERIAEILRERRAEGTQPHIVLLQEAFVNDVSIIAEHTGYKYVLKGPGRKDTSKRGKSHWSTNTRKTYTSFSDPQKLLGSGLYILSDFPIIEATHKAFDSDMCAGFDCLSNKSILLARVKVPGVDSPVVVINSHFNSHRAAVAPTKTKTKAHKAQVETLQWFLEKTDQGNSQIIAGDFNTKYTPRYEYFRNAIKAEDSAEICVRGTIDCALSAETRVEEILYKTNDKQFYYDGAGIGMKPIYITRNFTELLDGKPLSDHLGYEVHYKLGASVQGEREAVWSR